MALWGWLAYFETETLTALFQSNILIWGPALWFLYLALRLGSPRSMARFYLRGLQPLGRAQIMLFGMLSLGSLAIGLFVGVPMVLPETAGTISQWGGVAALSAVLIYVIAAHFGARPFAFSTGLVGVEGEPVIKTGSQFNPGEMRFPYRG